jgi:hypothetical protein
MNIELSDNKFEDRHEVIYTIRVQYSNNNKEANTELIRDSFFIKNEGESSFLYLSMIERDNNDDRYNTFGTQLVVEHILYSFNKKLYDRGIKTESIKKIFITISLSSGKM